jgi:hypothetical protein
MVLTRDVKEFLGLKQAALVLVNFAEVFVQLLQLLLGDCRW